MRDAPFVPELMFLHLLRTRKSRRAQHAARPSPSGPWREHSQQSHWLAALSTTRAHVMKATHFAWKKMKNIYLWNQCSFGSTLMVSRT
jgi:hypothetical protein